MYQSYFGLKNAPFSIVPDHRVVYMSESHRDAVAHLLYALKQSGGFVQLTGEVGTGKTTVSRYLLQHLPENVDVALLLNPRVNEKEMIETICDELEVSYPTAATLKQLLSVLNAHLLSSHSEGRHTVLIVDEAQNLSREVLEQIRLLTNLETSTDKLLQIILIGQPELVKILARHDLRQLSQRIVGRFKLMPLSLKETREYIRYRLRQAGCERSLFYPNATRLIHKLSGGVPRLINVLCDTALMGAYSSNQDKVTKKTVAISAQEVFPESGKPSFWKQKRLSYVAIAAVLLSTIAALQFRDVLPQAVQAFKTQADGALGSKLTGNAGDTPENAQLLANVDLKNGEEIDRSVNSEVKSQSRNVYRSSSVVKSEKNDLSDQDAKDAGKEEGKDVSSRFDLVYRLGVPYRNK